MNTDHDYLSCTLIGEARSESIEGIIAVGNVIKNRALVNGRNFKDICLAPLQFSCWNDNDINNKYIRGILSDLELGNEIHDPYLRQCIAIGSIITELRDNTHGAKNYVTIQRYGIAQARRDSKVDGWMLSLKESVRYGKHIFLV
jgi:hypothetical protein